MDRKHEDNFTNGTKLGDVAELWKNLSDGLDPTDLRHQLRHDAPAASRATKWIVEALASHTETPSLDAVMQMPIAEVANKARAAYLWKKHKIDPAAAADISDEKRMPTKVRHGGNEVARAVRRMLRFFHACRSTNRGEQLESTDWPEPLRDDALRKGMTLYRRVVRILTSEGIRTPPMAKAKDVERAAQKYLNRAKNRNMFGAWNSMVRQLRAAVEAERLPGVTPEHLRLLQVVITGKGPERWVTLGDDELVSRWPEHFLPDSGIGALSLEKGLPGFFNSEIGRERPANPAGQRCPKTRTIAQQTVRKRLGTWKRFLYFQTRKSTSTDLSELFSPDAVIAYIQHLVARLDTLTVYPIGEYHNLLPISEIYFGYDVKELKGEIEEMELPEPGCSLKGKRLLKEAGSPKVLLDWADAFCAFAAEMPLPSQNPNAASRGMYFVRKSHEISLRIEHETGVRPSNVERLSFSDEVPLIPDDSVICRNGEGGFTILIPESHMKQGKRKRPTTPRSGARREESFYEFRLRRQETIHALNEYLNHGWPYAAAVSGGRTRRLLINAFGEPFGDDGVGKSFWVMKKGVREHALIRMGLDLPDIDRYSHRHLVSEYLERYDPGSKLKSWYLTHSLGGAKSDKHYGDHNRKALEEAVDAVLDGKPPLRVQEARRDADREARELQLLENQNQLQQHIVQMMEKLAKTQEENEVLRKQGHQHSRPQHDGR